MLPSPSPAVRRRLSPFVGIAVAFLRALRSTAIAVTVALVAFGIREGDFRWTTLSRATAMYRPIFGVLFLALLFWELRGPMGRRPRPPAA